MDLGILKTTKIDVCLLGILIVSLAYQVRKNQIMHELKEDFRQIFDKTTNWLKALFKLGQWHKRAKKYFPDSGNTIIHWLDEIIAYFDNRTTSGVVEGINNKLKLIKRSAYGFRNFDNYKNRCLLTWHFNC